MSAVARAQNFGSGEDDPGPMIVNINVTPLVDITLVLLIIFMVTASYIVSPSIRVDLPKASTGTEQQRTSLGLTLTQDRRLYLNGAPSDDAGVLRFIGGELPKNPDLQALIAADRSVPHGDVVHLIDIVKRAGVRRFAINVDPGTQAPAPGPVQGPAEHSM
ncbi:MAG TPA: biopolymer transporter ExbD [Polyangia bacterium]|nr:biopolymer transporter ExbD [Polyangia bacterium]